MIKATLTFNGAVSIALDGENEADKQLLQLAFNGNEVKRIENTKEGGVVLRIAAADVRKDPNAHLGTTKE